MKYLRMYLQSKDYAGYPQHPQIVMDLLGIKWFRAHPESLMDGWFFEVYENSDIPAWIDVIEKPWCFSGEIDDHLIINKNV